MIYVLYGEDELSLGEELASIKEGVGPAELRDVNITALSASDAGFERLAATCDTVPFLSEKRLVIMEGLLSLFERAASQPNANESASRRARTDEWNALPDYLPGMAPTTDLVFVDARLSANNPMLAKLKPHAKVMHFPLPSFNELRGWIAQRAAKIGVNIEPRAIAALAETIGPDTRVIDNELQKLALYRWGQLVRREDVEEMVSYAKEASVFQAVDAVLEGRTGVALKLAHQILDSGRPPSYLITMIARQVRLLLLAKDIRAQGVPTAEIGGRLSLTGYPLRKTLEQEARFSHEWLAEIHRKLLEADLSVKTGDVDEQLVLDMLIGGLSARPPRAR